MADGNLSVSVDKSPQLERLSVDLESFDVGETRVQHYGLLMKKPFGHKSARWQKRSVCLSTCNCNNNQLFSMPCSLSSPRGAGRGGGGGGGGGGAVA